MKFSFRVITFIIALLVAGKEVVAFGQARCNSDEMCWSVGNAVESDHWLAENEAEEEVEDNAAGYYGIDFPSTFAALNNRNPLVSLTALSVLPDFLFLVRNIEFYIYVLNLRL